MSACRMSTRLPETSALRLHELAAGVQRAEEHRREHDADRGVLAEQRDRDGREAGAVVRVDVVRL